jgi:hypothetical protein
MRRQACYASTLAILAVAAHGETPAAAKPASQAGPVAEPESAAATPETSHWWSFDKGALLDGLGVSPDAGLFGVGDWSTIVDLRASGNRQETTTATDPPEIFYSYLTDEGITFRNDGWYVIDPRLLIGTASVRFGLQQGRQDASGLGTAQDADVTDYYFNIAILPDKPYNAALQASQVEYVTSHTGGGTTSSAQASRSATLYWREASFLRDREIAPYFSATLQGRQEDLQEATTNAGQRFVRDEHRDIVQFDAHNGFLNGDLTLSLEQIDLTNKAFPEGSYRSRTADVAYSLDFGEGLAKHSDAHFNYNERTGDFGTEMLSFDERLFFEHSAFLSSSASYLYESIDGFDATSTTHRVDLGVQYLPFLNVSTNLDVNGSRLSLDTGTIDSKGFSTGLSYSHRLPFSGALLLSAAGGLSYTDSQLTSSLVPVINAAYQAPPQLGAGAGFLLKEEDVVSSTIVIFDVRGGARLPTQVGVDYVIETEGTLTKIVPLVTSTVILPGDPLEVSYSYLTDPQLQSRIGNQSYYMSADWDWIAVSLTHDISTQDPLSGQTETLLSDQKRTALRIDVRRDWGDWRAMANARAARYRDERLDYDELRLNENLMWRPSYDWQLSLDSSQTQAEFIDSGRVSRHVDARLGGTWHSQRGWWADGFLTWRTERDSELVDETITEGFVRVRRNWPQLAVSCSVGVGQRDRDTVKTMYENIQLNITRTF